MLKSKLPLIIAFALTLISGVFCHVIKNGGAGAHAVWMIVQIVHIIVSAFFAISVYRHIKPFRKWYLKWSRKEIKRKDKVSILISVLGLFLCISGIVLLLFVDGAESHIGLWHWAAGLVFSVFCLIHILRRVRFGTNRRVAAGR